MERENNVAKKIKRSKTAGEYVDPNLEEVGEERAAEIEYDEDTHETLFVFHYRRKWGDEFDSDIEHGYTMQETKELIVVLMDIVDEDTKRVTSRLPEKSTVLPEEKNPLKDNSVQ